MAAPEETAKPPPAAPETNREYVRRRLKKGTVNWAKDTASGIVSTLVMAVFGLILVQIGLASEAPDLSFNLFSPYEFWKSFTGLLVEWSQWNEWLLLGLGGLALLATAAAFLWWRRTPPAEAAPAAEAATPVTAPAEGAATAAATDEGAAAEPAPPHPARPRREPLLPRVEHTLRSMRTVSAFGMIAALLFGAYAYQQYLWNVELPVAKDRIGIAFTRQLGGVAARDQLADYLRQMGHEGQIVMRDLPVTFDARDILQAQQLARRIGAAAVVIYREEPGAPTAGRGPGSAAPPAAQATPASLRHVAYIVFADPSLGVEIPVRQETLTGTPPALTYRTKEGVEVPRLEAADLGRLMEAAAGILLYDQDHYLAAVAHLRNALPADGPPGATDGLVSFYLGNAYALIKQDAQAAAAYDAAIKRYTGQARLSVQDRLVLAKAYTARGFLYFAANQLDQEEAALRQAVALREPLDKDQSALADPAIFREVHNTFGTAYVYLLETARYRQDQDTTDLWLRRAQEAAQALRTRPDDHRARLVAVWMTARTGDCEAAYQLAQDLLRQDPANLAVHQQLWQLAATRDTNLYTSIEAKQHLDAALAINPHSLPDLQMLLNYYVLRTIFLDPDYIRDVQATADRILEVDPGNVQALETVVQTVVNYTELRLSDDTGLITFPIGDVRTFQKQQVARSTDLAQVQQVVAQFDSARPYVVRWAEEVQPQAPAPLLYGARLRQKSENFLFHHQFSSDPATKTALRTLHEATWQQAITATNRVLEPGRQAPPRAQAEAHTLLSRLWNSRYWLAVFDQDAAAQEPALRQSAQHAELAAALLDANPAATIWERALDHAVYTDLLIAAYLMGANVRAWGHADEEARYNTLAQTTQERLATLQQQMLAGFQTEETYLGSSVCTTGQVLQDGLQALNAGDAPKARDLFQQYVTAFPQDPTGVLDLGWAQYLSGDLSAALTTTVQFEQQAPEQPEGPGNRAVILLALGQAAPAQEGYATAFAKIDALPLGLRLVYLDSLATDLLGLARRHPEGTRPPRDAIKAALPAFISYVEGLPAAARIERGGLLVSALNKLALVSLRADDPATARRFAEAGLAVNPDVALLHGVLAAAHLATDDATAAQQEIAKAVAVTDSYLVGSDGQPLTGEARTAAAQEAQAAMTELAQEFEAFLQTTPDLKARGSPLLTALQAAAARYAP